MGTPRPPGVKTIGEFLDEPENVNAYVRDRCPNLLKCRLISDGKGAFACRRCGVGFFVEGQMRSFDWHGPYPWVQD